MTNWAVYVHGPELKQGTQLDFRYNGGAGGEVAAGDTLEIDYTSRVASGTVSSAPTPLVFETENARWQIREATSDDNPLIIGGNDGVRRWMVMGPV